MTHHSVDTTSRDWRSIEQWARSAPGSPDDLVNAPEVKTTWEVNKPVSAELEED